MAKLKKRKDGRYQRKVTLSDGRQKIVYGKTLAELNAAEDALRAQDHAGLQVGDHTLVGEWAKVLSKHEKRDSRRLPKSANLSESLYFWAFLELFYLFRDRRHTVSTCHETMA